ncbi:hypothetical protein GF312_02695 [Candidatus Poribacteria bacterium]|nr:hypothetical protein [Candidatus Poribacteria bacterium]
MKSMNKLSIIFVMLFISYSVAYSAIDPESIAGVWLFEEGRGDEVEDFSGNEHHGQIMGAKYVEGKFGQCLSFEGNGQVSIESTEKLNLGDELTIMAYFNAEAFSDWHQIIAKDGEYLLRIDTPAEGTKMSAFVNLNGGWEPRASAFVPEEDTWYHFAAVYNSGDNKLLVYVDGVLSGQSGRDGKPNPTGTPVTLGTWNGGSKFIGRIDEVAIFNAALEEEDIMKIATHGLQETLGAGAGVEPLNSLPVTWGKIKR